MCRDMSGFEVVAPEAAGQAFLLFLVLILGRHLNRAQAGPFLLCLSQSIASSIKVCFKCEFG